MDETAFEKLRRIMPAFLGHQRGPRHRDGDLPEEVALKLTNRCNLRCTHCYQWNEDGHHRDLPKAEQKRDLDFGLVRELFAATHDVKPNMYLWGGEPLIYDHWDDLADLLAEDPRWTAICTNGLQIEDRLASLLRISRTLEMYVAVEGFADAHDAIRGRGTFARTMRGIDLLIEERRRGNYHGEISINTVITDAMVDRLCDLIEFFEERGVDTIYLSFLWYLSPETSAKMDRYVGRHFNWICTEATVPRYSWHAYKYHQDPAMASRLMRELQRVREHEWKRIKLRYNPYIEDHELEEFLLGSDKPVQGKTRCLAIHSRMDVMPNGDVVSCKFYPEFRMGNLKEGTAAAWQSERFREMRATVEETGLMPVCSKCNLLYSRGV
jgi:radical SAM protein with 4Fe4S-binding SPASM domain